MVGAGTTGQVDAELFGRAVVVLRVTELHDLTVGAQYLDVQAERLHLLDQHLERLRDTGLGDVLALDDRLVYLHAAGNVVGLDRQQLLQGPSGAVRLQCPDLHLAEPLAAELSLTAQGLLRDHRVGTGRTCVDLVVDQVVELQHVDVADAHALRVRLAGATVEERDLAAAVHEVLAVAVRQAVREETADLLLAGTVEDRRGNQLVATDAPQADVDQTLSPRLRKIRDVPAGLGDPAEVGLE